MNGRYWHCKNTLEQRGQHAKCKIHVPWHYFFYLTAALKYSEYMKIPLNLFPEWTKNTIQFEQISLWWLGLYWNEACGMGLTSGRDSCQQTPPPQTSTVWVLWKCQHAGTLDHKSRPISFTLVVDNFGVKYVTQEDVDHLITSIKSTNSLTKEWTGNLYCGITLEWDCINWTVDILMPGYINKKLQEYDYIRPQKMQTSPYSLIVNIIIITSTRSELSDSTWCEPNVLPLGLLNCGCHAWVAKSPRKE